MEEKQVKGRKRSYLKHLRNLIPPFSYELSLYLNLGCLIYAHKRVNKELFKVEPKEPKFGV